MQIPIFQNQIQARTTQWTDAVGRPILERDISCHRSVIGGRYLLNCTRQSTLQIHTKRQLHSVAMVPLRVNRDRPLAGLVRDLFSLGYTIESENPNCTEFIHLNAAWALQVAVFKTEIAFFVPYWDDADNAIAEAKIHARLLA
ncbi:MAG: hypothetical protein ACOVNQ_06410 [Pirellula sp.]